MKEVYNLCKILENAKELIVIERTGQCLPQKEMGRWVKGKALMASREGPQSDTRKLFGVMDMFIALIVVVVSLV